MTEKGWNTWDIVTSKIYICTLSMGNNLRLIFYHHKCCTGIIILKFFRQILFNNLKNVFFSLFLFGINLLLVASFFLASNIYWQLLSSRHQLFLYWLLFSWHQIFIGVFRVWRRSSLKEFSFSFQRPTCRASPAASAPQPWSREGFPRLEKVKRNKTLNDNNNRF